MVTVTESYKRMEFNHMAVVYSPTVSSSEPSVSSSEPVYSKKKTKTTTASRKQKKCLVSICVLFWRYLYEN